MRPWLPALLALTTAAPSAEETVPSRKLPAVSMLPDGSELQGVVIPRHDKNRRLVGSLKADVITLVNAEVLAGTKVTIDFYNDDGSRKAQINLKQAWFKQLKGMLESSEPVAIHAERFEARGKGLFYALKDGRGFLTGPATTWIKPLPETAMKAKSSSLIGASGLVLISSGALAEPPHDVANNPQAVMVRTVAESPVIQARDEARKQLKEDLDAAADAGDQARDFVEQTGLEAGTLLNGEVPRTHTKPLEIKPGPDDTVVNCDGGMYFDSDKGLLVYFKNVTVTDPRYKLSGADELKIFFSRKPDSRDDRTDGKDPDPGAKFDKVERIVATGAVRILQRAVKKGEDPIEASGAVFTYHPETGDIVISGGYPWLLKGNQFMRAKQPNLTLRMKKSGSFVTEGEWEMGGPLKQN